MRQIKPIIIVVYTFIFTWCLTLDVFAQSQKNRDVIDSTLSIGMTLEQILANNPHMLPKGGGAASVQPSRSGTLSIRGPVNFSFAYGDQSLTFNNAKAVLFPISNYKVKLIHLFPQAGYATHQAFMSEFEKLDKKMVGQQWVEEYRLESDAIQKALINRNQRDVASYRFKNSDGSSQDVQMIVTAYQDGLVKCEAGQACKNLTTKQIFADTFQGKTKC